MRFAEAKVTRGKRKLGLSVAFLHADARLLIEPVVNVQVQRFTSGRAVLQTRKVVLAEAMLQNVAVHCRRCAKCRHLVFRHLLEELARDERGHVVSEHGTSCNPLPVNLAPESLGPAGFGDGQMTASVHNVLPVLGGHNVSERIRISVCHHLRV